MNRSHLLPAFVSSLALVALTACGPGKEDKPPVPKVSAQTAPADASGSAPTPAPAAGNAQLAALPVLGAAPSWQLKDLNGNAVGSEQLKGKVVVVDFWATWCPPCRAEIPGYAELQRKYGKDGLAIVGVSLDQAGPGVVKAFATKEKVDYVLAMGDEAIVAAFGGVEALPTTFLIDRNGKIRDRKIGAEETADYEKKILSVLKQG